MSNVQEAMHGTMHKKKSSTMAKFFQYPKYHLMSKIP